MDSLQDFKDISKSFQYEDDDLIVSGSESSLEEIKSISHAFAYEEDQLSIPSLTEETFDDFDTVYEAMRTGLEMELKKFMANLFLNNIENFAWVFASPQTEVFKDAWEHALNKFTLRDQASRDQFLERIRILFRSIFLDKFNISDEQFATDLADAYFGVFKVSINQYLDKMKPIDGMTTDPAQDSEREQGNELTYR